MNSFRLKPNISKIFEDEGVQYSGAFDFSFLYKEEDTPPEKNIQSYQNWIDKNWHADMHFMEQNIAARKDARHILPNVQSGIVILVPYSVGLKVRGSRNPITLPEESNEFIEKTARYARGRDYHKVIKKLGDHLIRSLQANLDLGFEARLIVDSVPFFERAHAAQSGLGFIGKNTMLIRPGIGSFFFIATLLTTLPLSEIVETSVKNPILNLSCGECRRCLEACPTQALTEYSLDANKCLSYLSIENRSIVENKYLKNFKDIFFGCDICQTACPYNFSTTDARSIQQLTRVNQTFQHLSLTQVAAMGLQEYEVWFGGTSLTRAKYGGLVRNALYVLYATQNPKLKDILRDRKDDENSLIAETVQQLAALIHS